MAVERGPSPQERFTIADNKVLQLERLSYRARGLWGYILSQPPGFRIESVELARRAKEGRDAVRSALNELEAEGLLRRKPVRDKAGKFSTDSVLYGFLPGPENPSPVPPGQTSEKAGHTEDWKSDAGKSGTYLSNPLSNEKKDFSTKNSQEPGDDCEHCDRGIDEKNFLCSYCNGTGRSSTLPDDPKG